jgi:hypothetical protein
MSLETQYCMYSKSVIRHLPKYEKSHSVLWALTGNGIVLHNFSLQKFVELNSPDDLVWAYLDGAHSLHEVCDLITQICLNKDNNVDVLEIRGNIERIFKALYDDGFLVEKTS